MNMIIKFYVAGFDLSRLCKKFYIFNFFSFFFQDAPQTPVLLPLWLLSCKTLPAYCFIMRSHSCTVLIAACLQPRLPIINPVQKLQQ